MNPKHNDGDMFRLSLAIGVTIAAMVWFLFPILVRLISPYM